MYSFFHTCTYLCIDVGTIVFLHMVNKVNVPLFVEGMVVLLEGKIWVHQGKCCGGQLGVGVYVFVQGSGGRAHYIFSSAESLYVNKTEVSVSFVCF